MAAHAAQEKISAMRVDSSKEEEEQVGMWLTRRGDDVDSTPGWLQQAEREHANGQRSREKEMSKMRGLEPMCAHRVLKDEAVYPSGIKNATKIKADLSSQSQNDPFGLEGFECQGSQGS